MSTHLNFLHTADLQIGMAAPGVGSFAKKIQDARGESLRTVLRVAADRKVDFVLIAGDLFESNQISRNYVQQTADTLESAKPLRIFILPGNHDYYGPNSIYAKPEFARLGTHVRVLSDRKPVVLQDCDVTLYPSPCYETRSSDSPARMIKKEPGTKYHVALLHGSIPARFGGTSAEDEYFPMSEDELRNLEMDYVALGHWHSLHPDPAADPGSPFFYSGTPEPTGFGEKSSGCALQIELGDAGRKVTSIRTAAYQFLDLRKEIRTLADVSSLQSDWDAIPDPERTLLRIRLHGVISFGVQQELNALRERVQAKLAYVRVDDAGLLIEPNESDLQQFTKGGIAETTFAFLKNRRDRATSEEKARYNRAISLAYKAFKGQLD